MNDNPISDEDKKEIVEDCPSTHGTSQDCSPILNNHLKLIGNNR